MIIDKTVYYYIILFSALLFCFSFVPLLFEIIQQKITSNIPYSTLILLITSFLILIYVCILKSYYVHLFIYLIGVIPISIILSLKIKFDKNNIGIINYVREINIEEDNEEENE